MDMQGSKEVDIIATVTKSVSMAVNHMPVASYTVPLYLYNTYTYVNPDS